jgi:multicomponent K+:H+ antiporter subunit A/multicomponent Na+:H+ antiporter subunit A
MMELAVLIAVFLPFLAVPLIAGTAGRLGGATGWLALPVPVMVFAAVLFLGNGREGAASVVLEWAWVPQLGINLSFLIDGLSLFYGGVVSGVGILIFLYAIFYFGKKGKELNRFFAYLCLFMAAMMGTVFANNLITLFIFWETTGIASFLLIGFKHESAESRAGARMALLITMLTGLFMLAGFIMIGQVAGTLRISDLMETGLPFGEASVWLNAATVLVVLGAFGKSAQFPFHFWLPNAMAAPTPVSAYLHSATMVKLGVFLSGRMYPILSEAEVWMPLLAGVGLFTMLLAFYLALCSTDLKAILAYSTVGALGSFIGLYGLGPLLGVTFDLVQVFNHVLFKACLFMVVGIIDHATGIRDIRQLRGLGRRMPLTAICCLLGAACMAGIPLTTGFLAKELSLMGMMELIREGSGWGWYFGVTFLLGTVFKVAFAARLFFHVFTGEEREETAHHFHDPGVAVHGPPLFLALLAVVTGTFPGLIDGVRKSLVVPGLHEVTEEYLALWHGWTMELGISVGVVVLGAALYLGLNRVGWQRAHAPNWMRFDLAWEPMLYGFNRLTVRVTRALRAEQPMDYLPVILTVFVGIVGTFMVRLVMEIGWENILPGGLASLEVGYFRLFTAVLIIWATLGAILQKRWTGQLIFLSTVGFLITFYYVLYQAPDLAMTQILVEAATLLLLLILLARFPRRTEEGERRDRGWTPRNGVALGVAVLTGLMITGLMILIPPGSHPNPIGPRFLETTLPLAEGTNAVNTILVDFRGFDTMGEIAVLLIAVLGGVGLLMRYKRNPLERDQGRMGPPGAGIHSMPGERLP